MKKKIGVYVCHCGGNISDYVDIEKVKAAVKDEADVYLVKNTLFACADSSQKEMVSDIQHDQLDAIVVASCSPKLHLNTFRGVAERAGLNPYNYIQANIREQSSWAHSNDKIGATEKAILLVKAAIAKARESEALFSKKIPASNIVAVIGAGIGGMRTAISLADMGTEVYLIEKQPLVGGHVAGFGKVFPDNSQGKELTDKLLSEIKSRSNIKLFTNAELVEKKGSIGNFEIKVKISAETLPLTVGAFVVNTGFDNYKPSEGEYGFGLIDNVITLPDFKKLVDSSDKLMFNGKPVETIAYIYCVGSRQDNDGDNKYCSRYCCTAATHTAVVAKSKFKDILNLHFHRGIRTYGKQELIYEQASKQGDLFLQFDINTLPTVEKQGSKTIVKVKDILTSGKEIVAEADLVVLVTGMVPRENRQLERMLKIPLGRDNFFNEVHMKLRPVETVIDGVFIAGTCQSPKNILETLNSSQAAAAKANAVLNKGELSLEPVLAKLNPAACTWCGKCAEACSFDAIEMIDYEGRKVARIIESNCKGCGMCTPVCPTDAIDLAGFTNAQMEAMIDALGEGD
jgi:heterodisulfide reductase subunit A2